MVRETSSNPQLRHWRYPRLLTPAVSLSPWSSPPLALQSEFPQPKSPSVLGIDQNPLRFPASEAGERRGKVHIRSQALILRLTVSSSLELTQLAQPQCYFTPNKLQAPPQRDTLTTTSSVPASHSFLDHSLLMGLCFLSPAPKPMSALQSVSYSKLNQGLPWGFSGIESTCQCRGHGFNP